MLDMLVSVTEARRAALMRALDGHDAQAIEAAVAGLVASINELRQHAGRKPGPAMRQRLAQLLADLDTARMRVNYLSDQCRRHITAMAALRGRAIGQTYAPPIHG